MSNGLPIAFKRLQNDGVACLILSKLSVSLVARLTPSCSFTKTSPFLAYLPQSFCRQISTQRPLRSRTDHKVCHQLQRELRPSVKVERSYVQHTLRYATSNSRATPKPPPKRQPRQFPFGLFDEPGLRSIFGAKVKKKEGNAILQVIHGRRVSGELMGVGLQLDKDLARAASPEALKAALQWLRANFPVDEQSAAERWVSRQEGAVSEQLAQEADRMGIYRPPPPGESVVEQWAQDRKRRQALDQRQKEDSGELQRSEDMQIAKMEARRDAIAQRKEKAAAQIAKQNEEYWEKYGAREVPDMTALARLGPSTIFAVLVISAWVLYSQVYTPPLQSERFFPGTPTALVTVGSIVAINTLILCLWPVRIMWPILMRAFAVEPAAPHAVAMLGNTFSHREIGHLAANMLGLAIYGIPLHEDVGRGNFLAIYISGGVFGSLLSLYVHVLGKRWSHNSRGASGCVMAIMMAWAWVTAQKPAKDTSTVAFAWDVGLYASILLQVPMNFMRKARQSIDVFAHLGGALTGLIGAIVLTRSAKFAAAWPWSSSNLHASEEDKEKPASIREDEDTER